MEKMKWDDSLSVGINLIDEQHKGLIQKINDLSRAIEMRQGANVIVKTLGFLIDYTDFHFSTEEKHMTANNYPGLEHHNMKHEEFKETLSHLEEDFEEEGATQALADSINTLIMNWLIEHIKGVDQKFGSFLLERDISISE